MKRIKVDGVPPCPSCGAQDSSALTKTGWTWVVALCNQCGYSARKRS